FMGPQQTRAGDRSMKIIGMRRAQRWQFAAGLRPDGSMEAMGMDNATDAAESLVQDEVCGCIGTGLQFPFQDASGIERHYDHVLRRHLVVRNARRFDYNAAARPLDSADIAPGLDHQSFAHQLEVGVADLLFEFFEHRSSVRITEVVLENPL